MATSKKQTPKEKPAEGQTLPPVTEVPLCPPNTLPPICLKGYTQPPGCPEITKIPICPEGAHPQTITIGIPLTVCPPCGPLTHPPLCPAGGGADAQTPILTVVGCPTLPPVCFGAVDEFADWKWRDVHFEVVDGLSVVG